MEKEDRKMRVKKSLLIMIITLMIFGVIVSICLPDSNLLLWLTVGVTCVNCIIAWNDLSNRYTFLIFNLCFFTFLLGRVFFSAISNEPVLKGFSNNTIQRMYVMLTLSLISITAGMLICDRRNTNSFNRYNNILLIDDNQEYRISSAQISVITIAYYVTLPFYFLSILEKALYVSSTSYLALYISFTSKIPYILIKIGELNLILFALLFCVQYEKRKLKIPAIMFVIISILSLGIGQRNIFVLNIIMLACCLYYANKRSLIHTGEHLYSKRLVVISCLVTPIVISLLYIWGNYRQGSMGTYNGLFDGIKQFFISQGGQIEFFANTIQYKEDIWPQRVPYTFSAIYNYFRNLFGLTDFGIYTRENAYYGNSLGATQFYITSPGSLESGRGAGCCYLSELYYDAGMIGVVVGSFVLGYVLRKLKLDVRKKPWVNAFIILMIRWIVYIPRSSYFDWITNPFNIWNVAIIIVIFSIVNLARRSRW